MHRLITCPPKGMIVDHIDHNGLNNERSNLRLVTRSQNAIHGKPHRDGSSKYRGVYLDKRCNIWRVQLWVGDKTISLGGFKNEREAALVYDQKAREHFGEFAYLNFPLVEQ